MLAATAPASAEGDFGDARQDYHVGGAIDAEQTTKQIQEVTRRDATALQISGENGLGEDSMTNFVQQHLLELLAPFAAHVQDLQQAADDQVASLEETRMMIGDLTMELSGQAKLIGGLRKDINLSPPKIAELHAALKEANEEREALAKEVASLSSYIRRVDGEHRSSAESLLELKQELQATNFKVKSMRTEMDGLDSLIDEKVNRAVELLHLRHDELSQKHFFANRALEDQCKASLEQEKQLDRLSIFQKKLKKQHSERLQYLQQGALQLQQLLAENVDKVGKEAFKLECTKGMVSRLHSRVDQTLRAQTCFENWQKDLKPKIQEMVNNLGLVTGKVDNLLTNLGFTGGRAMTNFIEEIEALQKAVGEHLQSLTSLSSELETHTQRFESNEGKFEQEHQSVSKTFKETDVRIRNLADALGKQEEAEDLRLKKEQEALAEKRAMEQRIKAISDGLANTNETLGTQLPRLNIKVDETTSRFSKMENELQDQQNKMLQLSGSIDLTKEYWRGLEKGFRETHRSVALSEELLPAPPSRPVSNSGRPLGGSTLEVRRNLPAVPQT